MTRGYLDEQLTTDDGMTVVWGEWQNSDGERYETVSIHSALVSTVGAGSLLAALQTAAKFERWALPYATQEIGRRGVFDVDNEDQARKSSEATENEKVDDKETDDDLGTTFDEIDGDGDDDFDDEGDDHILDAGPLNLCGWLSHEKAEPRLDEYDPWGERVPFPGPAPASEITSRLGLVERDDGTRWDSPFGGILRAELWTQSHRSGRHNDTVSGERLSGNGQFLRDLLAEYPDRTLVLSVEIQRHPSQYDSDGDDFEGYPEPYIRYYLMGADGVATPL